MTSAAWRVTDFWLESPGSGSFDLRGKGEISVDAAGVHASIRPRGLAGIVIPTKEHRTYPIAQIVGWGGTGVKVEFTAGSIAIRDSMIGGLITTSGSSVPVHVCRFSCTDTEASGEMVHALLALGLDPSRIQGH